MSATPTRTRSGTTTPNRVGAYSRRRPAEFILPDGRKILVALPEEAETLRQKHAAKADGAATDHGQVEVVVHGSSEHCGFLRDSQRHHEARRDALRARHGREALDEWEAVSRQLDGVTAQLERLADHSAALKENFSKFGYDAHLRTYGEEEEGGSGGGGGGGGGGGYASSSFSSSRARSGAVSSSASLAEGTGGAGNVDWNDRSGEAVRLFKTPVVKQYFHRGLLWRSNRDSEVMPYELFFDLLFVGIIAINGDHASEEPTGKELLRFVITFCMSWKIWSDVTQLIGWFETGDVLSQVGLLFLFACLLGLTTNMISAFGEESNTFVQLAGYYITARLFMSLWAASVAYLVPMIRGMMFTQVVQYLVGTALWIGSTQVAYPASLGLIITALLIDIGGSAVHISLFRYARAHDSPRANRINRFFEFYPATNIEHKVERVNAFVCLVIGYGVVGVLYQNQGFGLNAFLGKAVLGLAQGYIFNWLYFEIDSGQIHVHAIRRHVMTAFLWQYAHLIFIMSYIISSAALSKLVLADDCQDASASTLTPLYEAKSEAEIPLGLFLFYCVGLGLALACMLAINLSHTHKIPAQTCRIPYWLRAANRLAVCVILCCLPAAATARGGGSGDRLNSLQLVGVATALSAWVLAVELLGRSCRQTSLFGDEGRRCRYTARCSRRELDDATKSDGEIEVRELGRNEKTAIPGGLE